MKRRILLVAVLGIVLLVAGIFAFVVLKQESAPADLGKPEYAGAERKVIGTSVQGRDIEAYTFGQGDTHVAFVGGMHGGYEWNSVLLAYEFRDYLQENPGVIPGNIKVSIIPNANPDGAQKGIGKPEARFNARGVDLNRNFDCKWQPESMWQGRVVSAGFAPFSEPEARAIRDFVRASEPDAVVFWHSKANAVYASECEAGILPETLAIMEVYADAAGYQAIESFDHYEITGDAEGWLASLGIPAITVELSDHEAIEWERNLASIKALFEYYSK